MPYTTIDQVITGNIPVLQSYMVEDPVEKTAFMQSGVLTQSGITTSIATGTSAEALLPFWKSIDAGIEPNYSNDVYEDVAVPRTVGSDEMRARVAYLNEGFGSMDLTTELTGQNPLQLVAARLDNFWARQAQRRLIATVLGIYNDNVANHGSDMVVSTTAGFDSMAYLDAAATMGDELNGLGVIAMHRFVYTQLQKQNLIDFVADSDQKTQIPFYQGQRVVVDSGLPVLGTGADRQFITMIYGPGSIAYGRGTPYKPEATERDESRGNGGGAEALWSRRTWLMHPLGYSFTSDTITGNGTETTPRSASWSDLALAANWERKLEREHIPFAFLVTGTGTAAAA